MAETPRTTLSDGTQVYPEHRNLKPPRMTGRPTREWTAPELARMHAAVESGVLRDVIAIRFACSVHTVSRLASEHGWAWPNVRGRGALSKTQANLPVKRFKAAADKKGWRAGNIGRPAFAPRENGCPARILTGVEFERRKRELEEREDRERRAAQRQGAGA